MLQLSGTLLNRPILNLRTGNVAGLTQRPLINPNNLKIEGFYCKDDVDRTRTPVLLYQDIRDVIPQGIVINDYDVLVDPGELVRLKATIDSKFDLIGKKVITADKQKIGKVSDFATEIETMYIQKLYITQSMLKNLTGGNLIIDRNQIVEINDKYIVIQDLQGHIPARAGAPA
ncbi:MAG TPA: PRC-barrel domain-containing protein [Candidatus Saccharimonadales bacterium]